MGDLLSSGALLVTVLSLFYTLWYPEIRQKLDTLKPRDHVVDSAKDIATLGSIIKVRVLPLLLGSAAMTIALMPDAWDVIMIAIRAFPRGRYDASSALYLLMICMMVALVVHVSMLWKDCMALLEQLRSGRS